MKTSKLKTLLAVVATGIIVLAGCNADDTAPATENAPVVDKDLIVMITSPIVGTLYNRDDPELVYTATEVDPATEVSTDVSLERLSANVYDVVDSERLNRQEVTNLLSGSTLPAVQDGLHQLEFIVEKEIEEQGSVTVFVNYSTDITPP
ncbi:MAG: hypothetical protein O7E56_15015, partial [SAR324 cluster bacterium]|nr:hypothetical protein [SAR324 cluster bacterium]